MILAYTTESGEIKRMRLRPFSANESLTIGRDKKATITIDDRNCSRIHSSIRYANNKFLICDMGSKNGTHKNGERIKESMLEQGDTFQIGNTVFKIEVEERPEESGVWQ